MERKSFQKFQVLFVMVIMCLCSTAVTVSTSDAQWWSSTSSGSSSSSTSSSSTSGWWLSSSSTSSSGGADTEKPVITSFTTPSSVTSTTVPITSFTATDNVGVTGYYVSSQPYPLTPSAPNWTSTPRTYCTVPEVEGSVTIYAWVKDAAGNVSDAKTSTVYVSLASGDTVRPVITSFIVPGSVMSRTIPIISFAATDDVGVTGYCVFEQGGYCNWTSTPPATYTPLARYSGTVTLMARVTDAAGNISNTASASVTGVPVAVAPDLAVTSVFNSSATLTSTNRTFRITDRVTNKGSAAAVASKTKYSLYYRYESRGPNGSITVIEEEYGLTGNRSVPALKSGASSMGTVTVTVPDIVRNHTYQVKVCADSENVVDELTEYSDNCMFSSTTVTVQK